MLSSSASSDASASRNCSRPRNLLAEWRFPQIGTLLVEKWLPQNARNAQNLLAEKYLPRIGTDAHRLGGYGILPYPRSQQNPVVSARLCRLLEQELHQQNKQGYRPQNARNTQNLLAEKSLPQIARIYTDVGGYGILPYPRSLRNPVVSARLCHLPEQELHQQNKQGYRPQNAQNTQNLLAEKSLPQIARIYTDVGGYGILPYPRSQQHPQTSVNSVNSVGELTQPTICVDL